MLLKLAVGCVRQRSLSLPYLEGDFRSVDTGALVAPAIIFKIFKAEAKTMLVAPTICVQRRFRCDISEAQRLDRPNVRGKISEVLDFLRQKHAFK